MSAEPNKHIIETLRFDAPVPYGEAFALQVARRKAVQAGQGSNALMLLEHPPVFTLGRNADEQHMLESRETLLGMGIEVHEADRGGDITYHGPGQLVAYPILDLNAWRTSINWYLRSLEDVLINLLAQYGLEGERLKGFTGVWVGGAKVAAVGVGINNWVTYHGISLNVAPKMAHWQYIVPCGIPDKPVTSLSLLLESPPTLAAVMKDFEEHFRRVFEA